jgi:PAS domain-containing protein
LVDLRATGCTSFLFELEKVQPEDLAPRKSRTHLTKIDQNICDRIFITDAFQRKGARKITWITYRQPMLEWGKREQEVPMHLMYVPISQLNPHREVLNRSEVTSFIQFVYLVFYYDGFKQTEKGKQGVRAKLKQWRQYLEILSTFCLKDVPDQVALQRIALSKAMPYVFISYSQSDLRLAQLTQEYLESIGIPVYYWDRDHRIHAGEPLWETILEWMQNSAALLFILTDSTSKSPGQLKEIDYARKNSAHFGLIIPMCSTGVTHKQVEKWLGSQTVEKNFRKIPFHEAIQDVGAQLLS